MDSQLRWLSIGIPTATAFALIIWFFGKFTGKLSKEFIAAVGMVFVNAWCLVVAFHDGEKKGREKQ